MGEEAKVHSHRSSVLVCTREPHMLAVKRGVRGGKRGSEGEESESFGT